MKFVKPIEHFIGDTFSIQDATAEITVGKRKDEWETANQFREIIENAGDILRELSSRGNRPDCNYIEEKIKKIKKYLDTDFDDIPDDIETLDDFNKTNLRFTNIVDSREYAKRFYSDIFNQTIKEYENIPVYSNETKLAKDLVLDILYGNNYKAKQKVEKLLSLCDDIRENGHIEFTTIK